MLKAKTNPNEKPVTIAPPNLPVSPRYPII